MGCTLECDTKNKIRCADIASPVLKRDWTIMKSGISPAETSLEGLDELAAHSKKAPPFSISKTASNPKIDVFESDSKLQSACYTKNENKTKGNGQIFFKLDLENYRIYILQLSTLEWSCNDLSKADVVTVLGRAKAPKTFLAILGTLTSVSVNGESILFMGFSHFEYDIETNCFYKRTPMNCLRDNPLIAVSDSVVYSISGNKKGEASDAFEVYDCQSEEWKTLENLRAPHVDGNSLVLRDENLVVVMGGYKSLSPMVYNSDISVYEIASEKWSEIRLEDSKIYIPKFINSSAMNCGNMTIIVFGTENRYECYEINLKSKSVRFKSRYSQNLREESDKLQVSIVSNSPNLYVGIFGIHPLQPKDTTASHLIVFSKSPYEDWQPIEDDFDEIF